MKLIKEEINLMEVLNFQNLKRDIGHDGNDGIGIILDPANKQTNGFYFVLSALNVQSEDQLSGSSGAGIN